MFDNRLRLDGGNQQRLALLHVKLFRLKMICLANPRFKVAGKHDRRLRKKTMGNAVHRLKFLWRVGDRIWWKRRRG